MKNRLFLNGVLLSAVLLGSLAQAQTALTLKASDGLILHATQYPNPQARAVLLMFHQAGSNKAEYAPIAPEFVKLGFAGLALDQRSGGSQFGAENQTVKGASRTYSSTETLPDFDAAIAWARKAHPGKPIWLMGSSYSSALVFLVAAKHPEVQALLSFSPDEYGEGSTAIKDAAKKVQHTAVFITCAKSEAQAARGIFEAVKSPEKTLYVPQKFGKHGASVLRPEGAVFGGTETWGAVKAFVKNHLK
ncbi:alpha/beta hydrolase [Deinococcus cellulosilyticus]|uniref:Serine aminopeptidase S33 domain-containing protein n=1 Tax=Deinococcus cellulosilyticus (strain DSM 18568 / NBRC 106333 / KACC 11606 / 5516J-15) TaxID=1223518 RepID=A0A511N7W4_DEIC1|nr:alpha/beta fold hydrolase [Deinococcus cellulosilyticus]GEM48578.1 hypothetical protein DC3_42130 [Deinococcus cellulosilyticus NBRC 106333 = KACC 11606]